MWNLHALTVGECNQQDAPAQSSVVDFPKDDGRFKSRHAIINCLYQSWGMQNAGQAAIDGVQPDW